MDVEILLNFDIDKLMDEFAPEEVLRDPELAAWARECGCERVALAYEVALEGVRSGARRMRNEEAVPAGGKWGVGWGMELEL